MGASNQEEKAPDSTKDNVYKEETGSPPSHASLGFFGQASSSTFVSVIANCRASVNEEPRADGRTASSETQQIDMSLRGISSKRVLEDFRCHLFASTKTRV